MVNVSSAEPGRVTPMTGKGFGCFSKAADAVYGRSNEALARDQQIGKKFYFMTKNKLTLSKQRKTVPLDGAGIDALSQLLVTALEQAGVNRKDIIRLGWR